MRILPIALTLLGAPALVMAQDGAKAEALTIGSPAPALQASRWLKGTPVPSLEKGKVYVVEFWATWCGPCRQTIPHLSEMAKKFEGQATFVGMSVWERGDSPEKIEANVDAFVKDMGDKMAYNVARDTAANDMAKAWMQAAHQDGIPAAFIINAEGRIAWIGHPMSGLEKTLENVLAGKHDLAAAKAEAEKEATKAARRTALINEFGKGLNEANKAKDYARMLSISDQAMAKYPEHADLLFRVRFIAFLHLDSDKAKAMLESEQKSSEPDMVTPARIISEEAGLSKDWYERAIGLLELELKNPEASPILNAYLAMALHQGGRDKEAVVAQEKLLAALRGRIPEARIKAFESELKVYQEAAALKAPASKAKTGPAAKKG
ncbi:MAG TPA: TlpA disulfide reductase family protein [Holophagaceae bacterium]|nr:TlpA disulfide reductase family protein [Holophagaceae bacterium]